ncbi:MAG: acyl carrier protein [Candidatus Marinimicrobia bacterium]|nr:acyl carrier protein [Candidatus Neomarinimicrobiota bacterium]MCH7851549.1 acyl carrier protein [Candidatus Neomarinimicrobiota bacterium]MCH7938290.1 acyl carrier protein [Candidatus Neomarinimicrobiota bacterium]MCH8023795.1 acyl carrier protein [Candidatus Neomarinimicrobiota bacterium]
MSDISTKIYELIADKLGVELSKISKDAKFVEDLGADSLDTVELIMQLEDEFNLEIPDEEAEKLTTVGLVIDYISSHTS